ncbi:chorismate synthase [Emericellopsis atlantica]|uniref:chorismate synthase n=1 Tax=Emericellopsis atlantica TaxID=2614577 RepID=A0A9P7ZQ82_9HYPO|nr:chorismate synthase [Emericellopsis atlantica]KAG9256180.1 chorismate synthase [Emericellopsis atlantica]
MSSFGHIFKVTTAGESHGKSVSVIIENCPPNLPLVEEDIQPQLNRRRPGQSSITTPRDEKDRVTIHSGTENGRTLGTPILLTVPNEDQRPKDYGDKTIDLFPRPSHADWTYLEKYGIKASSGGGRSSARETIARVAAGTVAEKWLRQTYGVEIVAFVSSVGNINLFDSPADALSSDPSFLALEPTLTRDRVDEFLPVRCPHPDIARKMEDRIAELRDAHDSTGGTVTCIIRNAPSGLGEPCFDKLEATLAHAIMSIPAVKGFEIGSGFAGAAMKGSVHNDPFFVPETLSAEETSRLTGGLPKSKLQTRTNHSGGIQGGISNGMPIVFRVAFKPPATISQDQTTAKYDGTGEGVLAAKGRHDPCVVPRAVPIVEAMAALTVADAVMLQHSRQMGRSMQQ